MSVLRSDNNTSMNVAAMVMVRSSLSYVSYLPGADGARPPSSVLAERTEVVCNRLRERGRFVRAPVARSARRVWSPGHHRAPARVRMENSIQQWAAPAKEDMDKVAEVARSAAREAGAIMRRSIGAPVLKTKYNPKDLLTAVDGECQTILEKRITEAFPDHAILGEESVAPGAQASANALSEVISAGNDWVWILDPVDGTLNFAFSIPLSCVSIGVAFGGVCVVGVIYDPYRDEMYTALKGHGATLNGDKMVVSQSARSVEQAVIGAGSPPNPGSIKPSLRGISALMPECLTIRCLGSAALMLAFVACGRLTCYFEPDLNSWDLHAGALLTLEAGGVVTELDGSEYSISSRAACEAEHALIHEQHRHMMWRRRQDNVETLNLSSMTPACPLLLFLTAVYFAGATEAANGQVGDDELKRVYSPALPSLSSTQMPPPLQPREDSDFHLLFCDQNCAFCIAEPFGSCQPSRVANDTLFLRGVALSCSENSRNNSASWHQCSNAECTEDCKDFEATFFTEAFCNVEHGISFICPDSHCFPGSSELEREDGSHVRMDQVAPGERVRVSSTEFSPIYMWGHHERAAAGTPMRRVHLQNISSAPLDLSPDHLLPLRRGYRIAAKLVVPASEVHVGDWLQRSDGEWYMVSSVSNFIMMAPDGKFAPHTLHGNLAVSGVVVSSYTALIRPHVAHSLLAAFRFAYKCATRYGQGSLGSSMHFITPPGFRPMLVSYLLSLSRQAA
ncbi:Inositol monophosphatase 2 [Porphyridium purpureum]|uniref:inositol-phosphate phosphatase n=1 Tax=Porphyridium purpureum TaxID=35688 RepID=A0A5J4YWL0_PORPP|nr:Inositol monophosphatase 2 [Porphyridium purpureum]|eukprot:POR9116..scf209_3